MMGLFVQLAIIGIWAAALVIHTRRLVRLAQIESLRPWDHQLRRTLVRVWWWLGREEYWQATQHYMAALSRPPTAAEKKVAEVAWQNHRGDGIKAAQDVFWVVLNSNEFILQH